jgi:intracellular sulfur oxidation DsrE/DsrF family protein
MKLSFASIALCVLLAGNSLADPSGERQYKHPVVKEHGGTVVMPDAAHQPQKNAKVILDITADKKEGSVILGLDRAALILNQYTEAGAGTDNGFKMAIILHGPATKAALTHAGYARQAGSYETDLGKTKNPNLELLEQLKKAGVEIYVCGQALAHHGFATTDVASPVKVAVSAATVNINLQMDGYAYIPFK